jgi:hypothetical protein
MVLYVYCFTHLIIVVSSKMIFYFLLQFLFDIHLDFINLNIIDNLDYHSFKICTNTIHFKIKFHYLLTDYNKYK